MPLLAGKSYDPATAVTLSTQINSALTAMDTTNLRLVFTAPASGNVLVRIGATIRGSAQPSVLLGVLSGASVIARQTPQNAIAPIFGGTANVSWEALFTVTGVSAGSHTWDAAYAVQSGAGTASNIVYGGANDALGSGNGGLQYEIYDAQQLLASALYDPAVQVTVATTTLKAMTAFDTTNLRLVFTAPASGNVLVRIRVPTSATTATVQPDVLLGILDGATVRLRVVGISTSKTATSSPLAYGMEAQGVVTGLTPGNVFTWDAAYAVQATAGTQFSYGGPNNASGSNATGGFLYEIWKV